MKKLQPIYKPALVLVFFTLPGVAPLLAQEQAAAPATSASFILDANSVLVFAIAVLAMVIGVLGYTLRASLDLYKKRKATKSNEGQVVKSVLLAFLSLGALQAFGQDGAVAAAPSTGIFSDASIFRYLLFGILTLELITVFVLVYWIRFFTGIEDLQREKALERKKKFKGAPSWWVKANKLKPMEEEASLDVGHSYDGIRELDNATPPWFTIAFIATIIFGLGYLWRYHVANAAPNQYEEYEISVTKANLAKEAYMKLKGDNVNETTVTMADAAGIAEGKKLFTNNCVACHGNEGQGGVGPNLTDDYWLHGGSLGDVFKVIKLGVVEKGMMSWKDVFSADQIAQIASYIKSIHGTKPAGAKEAQGELYKEESPKADSTNNGTAKL
ncbi:cbb3-type cytochrome c oxidase N-terminal domain-containing protein [Niabella aquatica]